jgi:hydrogenase expression/formation protein HypE
MEFPGGDIGSLAVIGTANDLAMAGARPLHLSVGLILEEGLCLAQLRRIIASMAAAARRCGLAIRTGDTKVVERGKADGIYINTSGIGPIESPRAIEPQAIRPGDRILVSGDLGRHGVAILAARHRLQLQPPLLSDCAPLWPQIEQLLAAGVVPHCLRDLTRGGLASALHELAQASGCTFVVEEVAFPVLEPVARTCELLGFDPLHLANEGRFVALVAPADLDAALAVLAPSGGCLIGEVISEGMDEAICGGSSEGSGSGAGEGMGGGSPDGKADGINPSRGAAIGHGNPAGPDPGNRSANNLRGGLGHRAGGPRARVLLRTAYGSERLLVPTSGELLPRIC